MSMREKNKKPMDDSEPSENNANALASEIKKAVENLYYMSETDAGIVPFIGNKADSVTAANLISQTQSDEKSKVTEIKFDEFFSNLTKIENWFGDEENRTAQKFSGLKDLLEKNLKDLKVFKIGQIEIDIYIVGLDSQSVLTGIKTSAVET